MLTLAVAHYIYLSDGHVVRLLLTVQGELKGFCLHIDILHCQLQQDVHNIIATWQYH